MEMLVAICIGALTSGGVYLILRPHSFALILGFSLLSYAVNIFIFAAGRLHQNQPPILGAANAAHADPLPQALVLTAIVISFGMTAVLLALAIGSYTHSGSDHSDGVKTEKGQE